MIRASTLALAGALVIASGNAAAQRQGAPAPSASAGADALAAFNRGVEQYDHHDFQTALVSFRLSFQLVPSPNSRLYVARCLRETGDLAQAAREFQATADEAGQRAARETRYAPTRDAARGELRDMTAHAGHLRIDAASLPADATVRIEGRDVPRDALAQAVLTAPGHVAVAIQASGFQPFEQSVEIAAGAEVSVPVSLTRVAAAPVVRVAGAAAPTPHGGLELNPLPRNLALVGAGVAVLGAVGFITFGVASNSSFADLQQRCGNAPCTDPADRSIAATGRTYDTLANVSLGLGIVGIAAGAACLVWSVRTGTRHEVAVGTSGTSITLAGRF
ncbi:MAG: hypothetical protein WCJ30_05030 [Deltaproteobacteria bacterium]